MEQTKLQFLVVVLVTIYGGTMHGGRTHGVRREGTIFRFAF